MNKILSLLILGAMMLTHESGAVPLLAPDGRQVPSCGALSDYSNPKAPKEIRSTEISSFSCHFSSYLLSLVREGGYAKMKMVCNSAGRAPALSSSQENEQDYEFEMRLPIKVLSDLERLIRNNEVARINGWHKRNSAIGCNFTLKVDYASGEVISASGEGGVSVVPDNGWRPMDFVNFFLNTAKAHGLDMRKAQRTWKAKHFIEPRSYASFMEQAVGIRLKKDCSLFDRVGGRSVIQGKKGEHFIGIREQLYDTSDKVWYLVLYGVERQEELYLNSLAKRCFVEAKNVSLSLLCRKKKKCLWRVNALTTYVLPQIRP